MKWNEVSFRSAAQPQIERGRPGDWGHACRAADWARRLSEGRGDQWLIIAAAYIHDIGWRDLVKVMAMTLAEVMEYETEANANSEPNAREFLQAQGFSKDDIVTVLRLIRAADFREAASEDEAIIIDADNLSKLCIEHLREKYAPAEWPKMISHWREHFAGRIRTPLAKKVYPGLLSDLAIAMAEEMNRDSGR